MSSQSVSKGTLSGFPLKADSLSLLFVHFVIDTKFMTAIRFNYLLQYFFIVGCFLLSLDQKVVAQSDSLEISNVKKRGKFVAFPLVFYSPETSVAFGGAGAYTFHWKEQSLDANPSQLRFVVTYTLENQLLLYAPFKFYFGDNDYYVFGEAGYFKYLYDYFGIGPNTKSENEESYQTVYPRFGLNITKRINKHIFLGVGQRFDKFQMKEIDPDGEIITGITGSEGGATSGLGFVVIIDSRDQIFYPRNGWFGDIGWMKHDKGIGSDFNYSAFQIDLSKYFPIAETSVFALNLAGRHTYGETPFYHLALHGGGSDARGYQDGRFRDRTMATLNAEYRGHLKGRFGGVVFANVGAVADGPKNFSVGDLLPAVGVGLRYQIDKENKLNIRGDIGIGTEGVQFYVTIGEAF